MAAAVPSPVAIGSTAVGIKTSEGVVMAVENRQSDLSSNGTQQY